MLRTAFWTDAPPDRAFNIIASVDAMKMFQGSRGVPGISDVILNGRDLLVRDSWGFWNKEQIVQFTRPTETEVGKISFRIEPNPLLRLGIGALLEEWIIIPSYGGSLVRRTFQAARPKPFWKNILWPSVEENNNNLRQALSRSRDPQEPLLP